MRIAFVSHEYPPDTGGGGIATYLAHVFGALAEVGHSIDVFCGASERSGAGVSGPRHRLRVHRIAARPGAEFRAAVLAGFAPVHAAAPFDVVEGTDFDAPGNAIKRAYPALPYVVKLHTPRFVIDELHRPPLTRWQTLRMHFGAWRRGRRFSVGGSSRDSTEGEELESFRLADELAAPSRAIAAAAEAWSPGSTVKLSCFPYPFQPADALLAVPAGGATRRITFFGRLEPRKGIFELAEAAGMVKEVHPDAQFRFVGRAMPSDGDANRFYADVRRRARRAGSSLEFTGPVDPSKIPRLLAETDIVAAPSHWESFGLVCCEALAAARAVVGSLSGGMAEILDGGRCGVLVPPRDPLALAQAIDALLADPDKCAQLGAAGRARVTSEYAPARVLPLQLASYARAIARCRGTGT